MRHLENKKPYIQAVYLSSKSLIWFHSEKIELLFRVKCSTRTCEKNLYLASFAKDHSPILFSLNQISEFSQRKGFWKFNKSLLLNKEYVEKIKEHILLTIKKLDNDDLRDEQVRWEHLKYEIRKFTTRFSKNLAKEVRKKTQSLEEKVKHFKSSVTNYHNHLQYIEYKERLNTIYSKKVNGIRIRSKCDWYDSGKKSTKFFLNLEKSRSSQGVVRSILKNEIGVKHQSEINNKLYKFYKNLSKENLNTSKEAISSFLENINLPTISNEQALECEGIISETELLKALKSMKNDKSPGNDGITKEFYEFFWDDIKNSLSNSIKKCFISGEQSTSQKQAVIKLIEKKDRDKRLIKNWRPISLLNIDTKLISKVIAIRLKKVLNNLISKNQIAYLNNRFISEGGRLISDINH